MSSAAMPIRFSQCEPIRDSRFVLTGKRAVIGKAGETGCDSELGLEGAVTFGEGLGGGNTDSTGELSPADASIPIARSMR